MRMVLQPSAAARRCPGREFDHARAPEGVLDLDHRLRAVSEEIGDLAREDADDAEEQVDEAQVGNMEMCTTSTNTADDYAHRGAHLQTMPFYVYRMYVRRVLKRSKAKDGGARFLVF